MKIVSLDTTYLMPSAAAPAPSTATATATAPSTTTPTAPALAEPSFEGLTAGLAADLATDLATDRALEARVIRGLVMLVEKRNLTEVPEGFAKAIAHLGLPAEQQLALANSTQKRLIRRALLELEPHQHAALRANAFGRALAERPEFVARLGEKIRDQISAQEPSASWMKSVLARGAVDPSKLDRVPTAVFADLSKRVLDDLRSSELGPRAIEEISPRAYADLGARALSALPESTAREVSTTMLGAIADPSRLLSAAFGEGKLGKSLESALVDVARDKLGALAERAITQYGGKLAEPLLALTKGPEAVVDKLIQTAAGKALDKLGAPGQAIKSLLLGGKIDTAALLKAGLTLIPGFGQAFAALSSLPVIGPIVDKVLGKVAEVLDRVPVVKDVLGAVKGIGNKIGGAVKGIGKALGKIF